MSLVSEMVFLLYRGWYFSVFSRLPSIRNNIKLDFYHPQVGDPPAPLIAVIYIVEYNDESMKVMDSIEFYDIVL